MIRHLLATALVLLGSAGASAAAGVRHWTVDELRTLLRTNGIHDVPTLLEKFPAAADARFTLAFASASAQGPERALLFTRDAGLILGVGARGDHAEAILAQASGKTTFRRLFAGDGAPTSCRQCHGRKGTYIFDQYLSWPGFFGEYDDTVSPQNATWQRMRAELRWQPLFALRPAGAPVVFPYYEKGVPGTRSLRNMPNTALTLVLGRRAARKLHYDIANDFPARYSAYRTLLARLLLDCAPGEEETERLESDAKHFLSADQLAWRNDRTTFPDDSVPRRLALVLLQMLGTEPYEIFLRAPLSAGALTHAERASAVSRQFGGNSPLHYFLGDARLGDFLLGLIWQDLTALYPPLRQYDEELLYPMVDYYGGSVGGGLWELADLARFDALAIPANMKSNGLFEPVHAKPRIPEICTALSKL